MPIDSSFTILHADSFKIEDDLLLIPRLAAMDAIEDTTSVTNTMSLHSLCCTVSGYITTATLISVLDCQ